MTIEASVDTLALRLKSNKIFLRSQKVSFVVIFVRCSVYFPALLFFLVLHHWPKERALSRRCFLLRTQLFFWGHRE